MENVNKNYTKCNSFLTGASFNMPVFEGPRTVTANMVDYIENIKISNNLIEMTVERQVEFSPKTPHIVAKFQTTLETQSPVTKTQFISDVKNGLPILNAAFARISLAIANMSSLSNFGPIIFIPAYDPKRIIIKE